MNLCNYSFNIIDLMIFLNSKIDIIDYGTYEVEVLKNSKTTTFEALFDTLKIENEMLYFISFNKKIGENIFKYIKFGVSDGVGSSHYNYLNNRTGKIVISFFMGQVNK